MKTSIDKALERLHWRISNNATFKPNQTDADAVNDIIEWVSGQQKETERDQQLFAKFYTYVFTEQLQKEMNLARGIKNTEAIASRPLSFYTDDFNFKFNVLKYRMYCETVGIDFKQEPIESAEDVELIKWHIENDKDFLKHVIGYWPKEKTELSLTNQITETLHKYKHLI